MPPLYAFLIGSTSLLLLSVIKLGLHYNSYQNLNLDVGAKVNELLMGERPYLGFIYLVSFCVCLYLVRYQRKKRIKIFHYLLCLIFCIFILFISARLSILSLLIIIGVAVFYAKNKKRTLLISLGGIVVMAFAGVLNPNFISRLTAGFEQDKLEIQKIILLEPRSHIWQCSAKIVKSNSATWMGLGFKNSINQLEDCYLTHENFLNEEHRKFFVKSRFNSHNQFINFYLSSGIFSLIVFLIIFVMLFKSQYKNYVSFALVLALFLFCIFENVLSRQLGAMMFGVVLSILSMIKTPSDQELSSY
ncbi:O-antigen ligase family protein [Moheibacter lacus]|uniref:O-antigen ligase family protein n=1 Tax=Moheibacter lacus TaxID=2745851 RepID=A0A838ZRI2_9FLAO|nr:O-antigen ligase family protein [Moheibacter lacus]MBA5629202.1 O-antigen ligase family protein [Moheibacter lacus]